MGAAGELPGGTGPGVVHIPWYATLFRGDKFAVALSEIAAGALGPDVALEPAQPEPEPEPQAAA